LIGPASSTRRHARERAVGTSGVLVCSGGLAIRVARLRAGRRPTILLIHGYGATLESWQPLATRIRGRRRVLAMDLRGHGGSAWPPDGDYSLEATVRDLRAVIRELAAQSVVLVGHSTGGMTALALCAENPGCVAALALVDVDPFLFKDGLERLPAFRGPEVAAAPAELLAALRAAGSGPPDAETERALAGRLRRRADGEWTWAQDPRLRPARSQQPRRSRSDAEVVAMARAITVPVLLVRGGESRACSAEGMRRFFALLDTPTRQWREIRDAGHDLPTEAPGPLADAIADFLDGSMATPSSHGASGGR
jgi:pimeloyl-ACP methyl ester carboxylesterase